MSSVIPKSVQPPESSAPAAPAASVPAAPSSARMASSNPVESAVTPVPGPRQRPIVLSSQQKASVGNFSAVPTATVTSSLGSGPVGGAGGAHSLPVVLKGGPHEAGRNLALGVVCALALIPLAGLAFWAAPRESFVALATAVMVGLLMFLAMQFRLLVQRNGVFLLLTAALTLTLIVPIGVRLAATGSELAQTFAEFRRQQGGTLPAASDHSQSSPGAVSTAVPAQGNPTSGQPSLSVPTPAVGPNDPDAPSNAAVSSAASERSILPDPGVQQDPYPDDDPVQRKTRWAKDEAIRRYPELQVPESRELVAYLEAFNELARSRKFVFFKDPEWPLKLAEIVAQREGWKRADPKRTGGQGTPSGPLPGGEISLDPLKPAGSFAAQGGGARSASTSDTAKPLQTPPQGGDSPKSVQPPTGAAPASGTALTQEEEEVAKSMAEARRRYPAVAREGSPENKAYLEAYQDLDSRKTDFFDKTDWPVRLVELVAKQEQWQRAAPETVARKETDAKAPEVKELPLPH